MATKSRKKRRFWILGGLGAGLILLFWLIAFHSRFDVIPAATSLPESVKPYREAGFYWTMADMPPPPLSAGENAAGLLLEAAKTIKDPKTAVHSLVDVPAARREVATEEPALTLAKQASLRPYLYYVRDWDEAPYTALKELAPERLVIKALCLRARCEAFNDAPAMRADLATALRLVGLYEQDSTLIAFLVQIACESIVLKTAEFCASIEKGRGEDLSALATVLKDHPFHGNLAKAMKGEAYIEVASLRNLTAGQIWSQLHPIYDGPRPDPADDPALRPKSALKRSGYPDSVLCRAFLARVLRAWTRVAPDLKRFESNPEELAKVVDTSFVSDERTERVSDLFLNNLFPLFGRSGAAEMRIRAVESCTLTLLGALEYQAKTGAYPTSMAQIPGQRLDPFSGKLLHLKRTADGIRIYSIGPNRIDADGVAESESKGKPYNIVASYPPLDLVTGGAAKVSRSSVRQTGK